MSLKNILKWGAVAGVLALSSCEKPSDSPVNEGYNLPIFKNISKEVVANNLQFPTGLAYGEVPSESKSSKGYNSVNADLSGVLAQGPLFTRNLTSVSNPKISRFSGILENLTVNSISEFDINQYPNDFRSSSYYPLADSLWRSKGLTLDGLILKGGGPILISSSSSNKIFQLLPKGIYLQDENLRRITDMIEGSDGKIYAVESPLINANDSSKVEVSKRVISIDNKIINVEFNIPTDIHSHPWWKGGPYIPTWWREAPNLEKLKIIENSELGKEKFGNDFYISDLLGDVIYKVDNKVVSVLAQGLKNPSSLAVDLDGNLYYTSSPLWNGGPNDPIKYPATLYVVNPETGESKSVFEFGGKNVSEYSNTGGNMNVKISNTYYELPLGFDVSNILIETDRKLNFLITNSHQGTLNLVRLDKE